ncbi:MAG: hypothetical protein OXD33_05360 [Rhodobacteraceae bacterium]|nr:hypothetical protein [Paracoccaceae bacterium]
MGFRQQQQNLDVFSFQIPDGQRVGAISTQPGQVPNPKCGHRIERNAFAQIIRMIELPVMDPRAWLQGIKESFNLPAQAIPVQDHPGRIEISRACGAQQHPVQRFLPAGRRHLPGRDGQHPDRLTGTGLRWDQLHFHRTNRELGLAFLAGSRTSACRNPDLLGPEGLGPFDRFP